jgi:diadenosine tetraphosphatase ApaH/serine/threonine PP2A family protein phosphatase
MAAATREELGEDWLRRLPLSQMHGPMAGVHASPESPWHSACPLPFMRISMALTIRNVAGMIVANPGNVNLSYDADGRAVYLSLDDAVRAKRAP